MKFARPDKTVGAINANLLGRQPDAYQGRITKNVVSQCIGKSSVRRIYNVSIYGNDFRLHSKATAVQVGGLKFSDGRNKIVVIPLGSV
jgi:hypothetical protein